MTAQTVIFSNNVVILCGHIGYGYNVFACLEITCRVKNNLRNALVDERHRKLCLERFTASLTEIISLVSLAYREIDGSHYYAVFQIRLGAGDINETRSNKPVN